MYTCEYCPGGTSPRQISWACSPWSRVRSTVLVSGVNSSRFSELAACNTTLEIVTLRLSKSPISLGSSLIKKAKLPSGPGTSIGGLGVCWCHHKTTTARGNTATVTQARDRGIALEIDT